MPRPYVEDFQQQMDTDDGERNYEIERYEDVEASLYRRRGRSPSEEYYPERYQYYDNMEKESVGSIKHDGESIGRRIQRKSSQRIESRQANHLYASQRSKGYKTTRHRSLTPPTQHILAPISSRNTRYE